MINQDINTFKGGVVEGPPAPVVPGQSPLPKTCLPLCALTLYQKVEVLVYCAGWEKRQGQRGTTFPSGLRCMDNLRCSLRRHFIHYCHRGKDV